MSVGGPGAGVRLFGRAAQARDRTPRLRRVLRDGRAAAAPRAGRQAGDRGRLRPARRGHDRVLRGAQVRGRLGDAGLARAPAVPDAIVIPPDFAAYRETSQRGVGDRAASGSTACSTMGIDEAYADLTGVEKPLRVLRELVDGRQGGDRHRDLGRGRPVAAGGQVLQRPRQAGRLRRDGPRGGVHALRHRADAAACPASARRPPSGWPRSASRTIGAAAGGRRGAARRALRRPTRARYLKARAPFDDDSPVETEQGAAKSVLDRADVRRGRRRPRRARGRPARDVARAVRGAAAARPPRADDRDQGAARRLDHGHARPHGRRRRPTTWRLVIEVAVELLRAYAPPRPVRLLGVRVAGFEDVEPEPRPVAPAVAGQLVLEV